MNPAHAGFQSCPFGTSGREPTWAIVVHGGAGAGARGPAWEQGCRAAAEAGAKALRAGGAALDAVEAAVRVLEDDPLFNAGTGAALNERGLVELDAAIMDGATLRIGGVCALPPFRNPIAIARAVLESGEHALYAGEGAALFATSNGFTRATSEELTTNRARDAWNSYRAARETALGAVAEAPSMSGGKDLINGGEACDTVGAVARDVSGRCAAATSTGGIAGKRLGRVGDSPLPGAGTYADERGAASATGHGEYILRACLARRAIDALESAESCVNAAALALDFLARRLERRAGLIIVDARGRLGVACSTERMPWAACSGNASEVVSGG